jgi:HK97 family phage major capsid protein
MPISPEDQAIVRAVETEINDLLDSRLGPIQRKLDAVAQRTSLPPGGNASAPLETLDQRLPGRRTLANIADSETFRHWLSSPRSYRSGIAFDLELKATPVITGISPPAVIPSVFGPPQPALRLAELIGHIPIEIGGSVEWTKEVSFVPAADITPETQTKPGSTLTFTNVNTPFATIATVTKASLQSLSDILPLQNWISARLAYAVALKQEDYLLNDTTSGLLKNATPLDPAYDPGATGTTTLDYVGAAISQLQSLGYTPDGVVLSGVDAAKARLLKTSFGSYLWASPDSLLSTSSIWGTQMIISPSLAAGTFVVGDFRRSCLVFDRWQMRIDVSYENEADFIQNLACFRSELRCGLAIFAPSGVVTGTLPAGLLTSSQTSPTSHSHPSGIPQHTAPLKK